MDLWNSQSCVLDQRKSESSRPGKTARIPSGLLLSALITLGAELLNKAHCYLCCLLFQDKPGLNKCLLCCCCCCDTVMNDHNNTMPNTPPPPPYFRPPHSDLGWYASWHHCCNFCLKLIFAEVVQLKFYGSTASPAALWPHSERFLFNADSSLSKRRRSALKS